MSNQYINFSYNPARDGFSTSTWRELYGTVSLVGGKLDFNKAAIIHFGDILRGDITYSLNIPAPLNGVDTTFGLILYSKGSHAYFSITDQTLVAETSDGTNITSVVIPWQTAWTGTDTEFRIKWEAGTVNFYIAGNLEASINDVSVSGDPMSLYIAADGVNSTILNYINVKTVQSFVTSEGNADSVFEPYVKTYDRVAITDVPTVAPATIMSVNKFDSVNISDSPSTPLVTSFVNKFDTLNISESKTVSTPA